MNSCAASSVKLSEELVRELATAAKTIGNDELAQQLWLHGKGFGISKRWVFH